MGLWQIRKLHGADKLWQSYIAYRVRNETDPEVGRFVEIRQVAEELCRQTEVEYEVAVDGLSWLALERGDEAPNQDLNLLSAAAYFGHLPLARRLLADGHCPASDNDLFLSPMQLAAWTGNADMLKVFQKHLPEFEKLPPHD